MVKKKIPRIATFDILRGYLLVGIFIDHLNFFPNGLDWWSARGSLFVTMAEGFFLISGIILGIVRGSKLVDVPFRKVAKLLLNRGFQLYATSIVLTLLFTVIAWSFFMGTPGLKPDLAPQGTPIWQLIWETLTLQYFYGWADYLRLYAVFLFASPLFMWLLRQGKWYIGLMVSAAVWLLFPDPQVATGIQQEQAQLLSWQFLFFIGLTIGFYWGELQERWQALSQRVRRGVIATLWMTTAVTIFYSVATTLATMGYDMSWMWATSEIRHELFVHFFDKEQLPLTRIILAMVWFWAAFSFIRMFESPIKKWIGWLLVPYGMNSLYVYTVHAFIIFFLQVYFASGSLLFNLLISLAGIFLTLVMIRYKVLMKIIPR